MEGIVNENVRSNTEGSAVACSDLFLVVGEAAMPVIELAIEEGPNRHGTLLVTTLAEEQIRDYILFEGSGNVTLIFNRNGTANALFQGILTNLETMAEGNTHYIRLQVRTSSYQMDIGRLNLSFQDLHMTSHELIRTLLSFFPDSQANIAIPEQAVGHILVQYQETVWEFLKRFLSEYGACVYVDSTQGRICLQIGLPETVLKTDWDHLPYVARRDTAPQSFEGMLMGQLFYEVSAYELLPLGAQIRFHGRDLYIGGVYRSLEGGLLVSRYQLYFKEGLQIRRYFNPYLGGVSINGSVTAISRNKVQVRMETDALRKCQKQYLFPFSTVAASSDGSGWYCMPREGDMVRIFFPVSDEREGYAISNVMGQSAPDPSSPMGNPDLKDITTPDGKTVQFIENGIQLSVGSGKGAIVLTNDGNARIVSEENIEISAAEKVLFHAGEAGELVMAAGNKVQFTSDAGAGISVTKNEIRMEASIIINN